MGCVRTCSRCLCDCAVGIIKLVVYAFNVFFWVAGCFLVSLSITMLADGPAKDYVAILEGVSNDMWIAAMSITLIVGVMMFLAGCLGCYGGWKSSSTVLLWYAALMIVVVIAQCTVGIYISIQVSEIEDHLGDNMKDQIQHEYGAGGDGQPLTDAWDSLQENLECCGATNYIDYRGSYYENMTSNAVPESCCDTNKNNYNHSTCKDEAASNSMQTEFLYTEGCYGEATDSIADLAVIIYTIIYIIAVFEVACIFVGCCARYSIRKQNTAVAPTAQSVQTGRVVVVVYNK